MATSVVIPIGYGLATYHWTFNPAGKEFTTTMGYKDVSGLDDPSDAALVHRQAMVVAGGPAAATNMTTDWRFEGVTTLQRLSSNMLQTGASLIPTAGTATSSPNLNPVFITAVVSKRTVFAGRAYRGRMYPPLTIMQEALVDYNGVIPPAQVTTLQGYWNAYWALPALVSYYPYLLHATDIHGVTPFPTAIQGLTVQSVVGIQRRRRASA